MIAQDEEEPGMPQSGVMMWRQWFGCLGCVLAEPWRYLLTGDERASAGRYRAACGARRP
jgi:hypothetical protein